MKVTLIKDGPYESLYRADSGIIYTKEEAEIRFPEQFKTKPTAVKKSAKRKK